MEAPRRDIRLLFTMFYAVLWLRLPLKPFGTGVNLSYGSISFLKVEKSFMRKKQQPANDPQGSNLRSRYLTDGRIFPNGRVFRIGSRLGYENARVIKVIKSDVNSICCYLAEPSKADTEKAKTTGEGVLLTVKLSKTSPKPQYGFGKRSRVAGIGTFFDFMGFSRPELSGDASPQSDNGDVEDRVALANDWGMVGSDMTNAMIVYGHSKK